MSVILQAIHDSSFTEALGIKIEEAVSELSGIVMHPLEGERPAVVRRFTLEGGIRTEVTEEAEGECEVAFQCGGTADLTCSEADGGEFEVAIQTPCSGVASVTLPDRETVPLDLTDLVARMEIVVTLSEIQLSEDVPADPAVE